jgi:uncharacterized spore protein YtfJ
LDIARGKEVPMDVLGYLGQVGDAVTVKRVFGEPYERDGVTIIPAALVLGGGGGGGGEGPTEEGGSGSGGGFGVVARPAGAYVIKEGRVTWTPAVDVNRIVIGCQIVALVAILARRSVKKARAKRQRS